MGKLDLDWGLVKEARESAKKIAADSQVFIDAHSTVTVERTICRLLGIDGVDEFGVPLPNVVVDFIKDNGNISLGIAIAPIKTIYTSKACANFTRLASSHLRFIDLLACRCTH